MKREQISLALARRIALNAQLLDRKTKLTQGKSGIVQTIDKLGYVQIDPLSVIERAHHHTLWTRLRNYEQQSLYELQSKDRRVFEYWGHALSYFPMSDYRFHLPRMRNFENPTSPWAKFMLDKYGHMTQPVLDRVLAEGPLSPKDFEAPPNKNRNAWPERKPAKGALDLLFWKGDLMVTERRDLEKFYDLAERVLPADLDTSFPDAEEVGLFLVRRALQSHGVVRESEVRKFMQPDSARDAHVQLASRETISKALSQLVDAGEVLRIAIEGDSDDGHYALSETIEKSARLRKIPSAVHLLSPFDNLIIQRERTKRLFGFDYVLECYTPAAKRKYGYYVLPILLGDSFVGRLDPKADRKKKTLIIRNLAFEPEFKDFDDLLPLLANKLGDVAKFNACAKIEIDKISPAKVRAPFLRFVKALS